MNERSKNLIAHLAMLLVGIALGALCLAVFGCGGVGPGYLLSGLVADSIIDGLRPDEDGADGTHCWDWFQQNGECDEEEDANGDGACDALDCRGEDGSQGPTGDPGLPGPQGIPGATGPVGPQGVSPPPVVIVVRPVTVQPEPVDDEPPYGHGPDGNGPPGQDRRP